MPPEPVSLLQAKENERPTAGGNDPVFLPGGEGHVPELRSCFRTGVEFPAELAHIGQAHRGDRDAPDDGLVGAGVLQGLIAEIVATNLGHDFAGQRAQQPDAAAGSGDVAPEH